MTCSKHILSPLFLIGLLLGLAGCSSAARFSSYSPQRTILAADRVALPTIRDDFGMLWVEARVNGAGPFRLLVDTGCDVLVLAKHAADAAGLKALPNQNVQLIGAIDNVPGKGAPVQNLESGGLKVEHLRAMVMDNADLANIDAVMARRVDGVLGMATLKDVVLEMDFAGQQVTVVRRGTGHYPADRAVAYRENSPKVMVDLGGKPFMALIDTGAALVLQIPQLDAVPLLYPKIKADGGVLGIGKSTMRGETAQLAGEAHLGPITWVNPPIGNGRDSLIGVDAIDAWVLAIDQHTHRIYFLGGDPLLQWDEQKSPDLRFKPGYHARLEGTGLRLLEVDSGGAFDLAGLRVGDVILTVGDVSAVDYILDRTHPEIKNNNSQRVRVRRDNTEFETTVITGPGESREKSPSLDPL